MIKGYTENCLGLEQIIIKKVRKLDKRSYFLKQIFYLLISTLSLLGIAHSFTYILNLISESGLYQYITLIFSNTEVLSNWKELSLSILESVPFLGLAMILGSIGVFLWSIFRSLKIQVLKNSIA